MKQLGKYSFGIGDRFSHEGKAQLSALINAEKEFGIHFVPVWNKSNREHQIIGTEPSDTRREADDAVKALGYNKPYFVDADHIGAVDTAVAVNIGGIEGEPLAAENIMVNADNVGAIDRIVSIYIFSESIIRPQQSGVRNGDDCYQILHL